MSTRPLPLVGDAAVGIVAVVGGTAELIGTDAGVLVVAAVLVSAVLNDDDGHSLGLVWTIGGCWLIVGWLIVGSWLLCWCCWCWCR